MSIPFRLSAVLLASLFLVFPLHFAIATSQTSPQSEIVLSSNDDAKSDQQTTTDTSNLTWLCPNCGAYVPYKILTCPQCGTQRPSLTSSQLELYKSVKKHPRFKKTGIVLSVAGGGLLSSALIYGISQSGEDQGLGGLGVGLILLSVVSLGAILGTTGLVMLLASRGTKMEKLPQEQYPQFGYHWQEKLEPLGNQPKTDGTIVPLLSMSFTF
jgi:hypothetical protein